MSVVIVGGHDRMVAQYKKICKSYKCKVKVFTHMGADFNKQIGCPDLLVLFTNTVSHKMVRCALDEIDGKHTDVVRCHTSSGNALTGFWKTVLQTKRDVTEERHAGKISDRSLFAHTGIVEDG